ncbi:hypothetical protein [Lactovum odontotermitis]
MPISFLADGGEIAVYKSAAKVNFHMEQTEKVGFKDAEVVIWYLVKGGVAINLNDSPELKDVSEFLRKRGPKLNKKAYLEITYSEAQKMTADSTGGLNYFSYYFNQMTLPVKDLIGVALATKAVKMTGKFPGGVSRMDSPKIPLKNTGNFAINSAEHIVFGEISLKGKPVGLHTENNLAENITYKLRSVTKSDINGVY